MQESQDKKLVEDKVNKLFQQALQLEQVALAVKSQEGQKILERMNQWFEIKNAGLNQLALRELTFDSHYEYSKDDLQKMKSIRAQIAGLKELFGQLDPDVLTKQVNKLRKEAFELSENPQTLTSKLTY